MVTDAVGGTRLFGAYLAIHAVLFSLASIAGIAFDGMNYAVFAVFNNTDMVHAAVVFPIEENNISGDRGISEYVAQT